MSFGTSIHWPSLDVQFTTIAILEEMFGVKTVHSAVAKGGSARTEAKSAAARANGALGGRPRKDAKKVKASPKTA